MRSILAGGRSGRRIVAAICAASVGVAVAPGVGSAVDCGEKIRVLLHRGADPVRIESGRRSHTIEVADARLQVDGRAAGVVWRSAEGAEWRVGKLRVKGVLEARAAKQGLTIVNEVGLEDYVAGALGGEIPARWAPAALRAQAVVSRTYALHQSRAKRGAAFDVEATTRSQVYVGTAVGPALDAAVSDTRCEFLSERGEPILAVFHSASGGRTASALEVWGRSLGYLVSIEIGDEDDSPDTYWRTQISGETLGRALAAAGHRLDRVDRAEVEGRSDSGRVSEIRLEGTFRERPGAVTLSGRALRSAVGESTLKSTLFELKQSEGEFIFVGSGRGHGVGMSQWGARAMALGGSDYREILELFYPGTRLERWRRKAAGAGGDGLAARKGSQL